MNSTPIRFLLFAIMTVSPWLGVAAARGQTFVAGQAYSRGVKAYFAGRDGDAEQELLAATADDVHDPRPHFFRALILMRQGRSDEARGEMMLGAALEAQRPGRYPVGQSLERVQGGNRLQLETYRREARTQGAAFTIEQQATQEKSQLNAIRDLRGLRTKVSVPLDQLTSTSSLDDFTTATSRSRSNAAADRLDAAVSAPASSAPAEALPDPFVDDAQQPAAESAPAPAAEDDPFAASPAAPAAEAAAESGSKVSSGKLLGILGRVVTRSAQANMSLLEEVSNKIPLPPGVAPSVSPPGPQMTPEAEFGAAPAAEDPFAETPQQP